MFCSRIVRLPTQRLFSSFTRRLGHENPLGLPKSGSPPQLPRMQRGLPQKRNIPNVKKVVAVSSAKGGVGKSTVAVNVALAMQRLGKRVGLLDADIFGPSVPKLLNLSGEPMLSDNHPSDNHARPGLAATRNTDNRLIPMSNYGIQSMSMGYLVGEEAPVVWRGLMVMKAMQQLLHEVEWDSLDVLVLDMPPGTGDIQLTISQQVILDGAIIVSTPQDIALIDAIKGINMFGKVGVPILGMVQNMSVFICPNCSHHTHIFGTESEGSRLTRECTRLGIDLLGDVPLHASICQDADRGVPTVVADAGGENAKAYMAIAERVAGKIFT